jgi:hypothetical protein
MLLSATENMIPLCLKCAEQKKPSILSASLYGILSYQKWIILLPHKKSAHVSVNNLLILSWIALQKSFIVHSYFSYFFPLGLKLS